VIKLKTKISKTYIKDIKEDIKKAGFPLEISISTILKKKGWNVENQVFYFDKEKRKNRTIDILAQKTISENVGSLSSLEYSLVIECKKSEKPWVFYTNPRNANLADVDTYVVQHILTKHPIYKHKLYVDWIKKDHHQSYSHVKEIAVNAYEPFKKGKGKSIPTAFYQVSKALLSRRDKMEDMFFRSTAKIVGERLFFILYPVVVFEGSLFSCIPTADDVNVIDQSYFCYSFSPAKETFWIDIVEANYFEKYLDMLDSEILALIEVFKNFPS
jgi:urate oxidase